MTDSKPDPRGVLQSYRLPVHPIFIVGAFDKGVTVFDQQIRALNLVWALVETGSLVERQDQIEGAEDTVGAAPKKVAIVGAGFSGLTAAAGLIAKKLDVSITLFEQRDALLPLQQGSDSRWLHPRIYDWPADGSEANVAMLPILNWSAGRASDVVVQILGAWRKQIAAGLGTDLVELEKFLRLYCNAGHLQIRESCPGSSDKLTIEWVGEARNPIDGTAMRGPKATSLGGSEEFDIVILTIGFGLERDKALSYWRNETLGQPSLGSPSQTFLVSGQGDGAMIDLLRLRISQYRQDRILDELFSNKQPLLNEIKALHKNYTFNDTSAGIFSKFEMLQLEKATQKEFDLVVQEMEQRLRRDTRVVLHLKVKNISELFEGSEARISFQNKLLVYFLYKCGGFIPSCLDEKDLIEQHGIKSDCVVRRHGTLRDQLLRNVLSENLNNAISSHQESIVPSPFCQTHLEQWRGGYFGFPGKSSDSNRVGDSLRQNWRREYLPGVTEIVATTFCASLAGLLLRGHETNGGRLRVTLHRTLILRKGEELLQQTCDYEGTSDARADRSGAARTFPVDKATIGLAYSSRKIVRSKRAIDANALSSAMADLDLAATAREMSNKVRFVLAIPMLEYQVSGNIESRVIGVIYIDSEAESFFICDTELRTLVAMANAFMESLERLGSTVERIRNVFQHPAEYRKPAPRLMKASVELAFELVNLEPPSCTKPLQFNYDYSDFIPVKREAK